MSEICAVLEHTDTTLHEQSGELLSELVDIAQRQPKPTTVCAMLLISQQSGLPDITLLPQLGVHHLYLLEHPQSILYSTESYVAPLGWFIQHRAPMLVATIATQNYRACTP